MLWRPRRRALAIDFRVVAHVDRQVLELQKMVNCFCEFVPLAPLSELFDHLQVRIFRRDAVAAAFHFAGRFEHQHRFLPARRADADQRRAADEGQALKIASTHSVNSGPLAVSTRCDLRPQYQKRPSSSR